MSDISPIRTIRFTVDGVDTVVNLPDLLKLRKNQNKACNAEQHLCGLYGVDNQKVCLKIKLDKDTGNVFDMNPCSKNPENKINIEG